MSAETFGRPDPARLSFAQERLWFLERLAPGSGLYNIPFAIRIASPLDTRVLQLSVEALVARHEALRTHVELDASGLPLQMISQPRSVPVPVTDLSAAPPGHRQSELQRLLAQEAARPFDLSQPPLFRVGLIRLAPDDHVLYFTMHHIVSDGWSISVMCRDLGELYQAWTQGRAADLPPLAIRYRDYSQRQRERFEERQLLQEQLDFWKSQLAGAPTVLELPTDKPRPWVQSSRGARHGFSMEAELATQLRALAGKEEATPFMGIVAAFSLLLARYSGQDDILIGLPSANREAFETEELVGCFVNMLVLRADLSGTPTFRELLRRVRAAAVGAFAHQETPLEKLVEMLQPERDAARHPLFQVMVNFTIDSSAAELPPAWSVIFGEQQTSKFDLTLYFNRRGASFSFEIEYATDLFAPATIERFAGHLRIALHAAVTSPDRQIWQIPVLTGEELHALREVWSGSTDARADSTSLIDLFHEQVGRTPNAIALSQGEQVLTYADLDQRANQLAHHLVALGVRQEMPVGLLLERDFDWVTGVLAVLKAGGCYVPLDVLYPRERLARMARLAGVKLILTWSQLHDAAGLRAGSFDGGVRLVELDRVASDICNQPVTAPHYSADPDHLAYILFTSGSTGQPKGVMVRHRGAVSYLRQMSSVFDLGIGDCVLQVTSASFDPSIRELFATLSSGARLVLPPRSQAGEPAALLHAIQSGAVTKIIGITPSMLKLLLSEAGQLNRAACRLALICPSGEALEPSLCDSLRRTFGGQLRIVNVFGPTESTMTCCCFEVPPDAGKMSSVPIGRPIGNYRLYVLDGHGELAPIGVPGELHVGGIGVGRGYVSQPGLTAERFIPNQFANGERLYRTGDRARWLAIGVLEFLGRTDQQLKVRGYRIEPGEIEAVLLSDQAVSEAVVVGREDTPGDQRLVAYLVANGNASIPVDALRDQLRRRVPAYMVPSAFVRLDHLPLTPNGKIDRKALPMPGEGADERRYDAPRTPMEQLLAAIWARVLRVERVGARDNFFELGGHSLLATRVAAQIREVLQLDLPLRTLFESPTVALLAVEVETLRRQWQGVVLPPLEPQPRSGPLPLSLTQERLWFLAQLEGTAPAYNLVTSYRLDGSVDVPALQRSFAALVERHESLRTRFAMLDGEGVQIIEPPRAPALEIVDLSSLDDEACRMRTQRFQQDALLKPFDLSCAPPLRICVLRLSPTVHILQISVHHIIADAWSLEVLVREWSVLYAAFLRGQASPLSPLPIQYADYALWHRRWVSGETLARQLDYWRQVLSGAQTILDLPTDRPRPAIPSFQGASLPFDIGQRLSEKLRDLSHRAQITLFMVLLAAVHVVLRRWSRQDDISFGTAIAGRNHPGTEGLIGFFVNTLVLRTDLSGNPSFRQLLERVKEVTLGAYAHQDVPFEKLVAELQPQRHLSRQPLFQVALALYNPPEQHLSLPGLALTALDPEHATAKFDLTLYFVDKPTGLSGFLQYATDLFERSTIERLCGQLKKVLEEVVADPEQHILEIPLLDEAERHRLLTQWNEATAQPSRKRCIHEWFDEQAARTPDAVAVIFEEQRLPYQQLAQEANQLAHELRSRGVGPDVLVGLCMDRSLDMIVGVLAILKAGGAYVPLDASYPSARLGAMIEDADVSVLLTHQALLSRFPAHNFPVICLDAHREAIARWPRTAPASHTTPHNLAYVIYTSGSTGKPKGASITHGAVTRLFAATEATMRFGSQDVWTMFHSHAFDFSVWEMWGALLYGGRLVVVPFLTSRSPRQFYELLLRERVTVLNQTPSAFAQLVRVDDEVTGALALRLVIFGGEALNLAELRAWFDRHADERPQLINMYGITETTVHVTCKPLRAADLGGAPASVIGNPLADMQIYLLDEYLEPVPQGVPGEVYVAGEGLARGYLRRPGFTAERFAPDPFGAPGGRLYRSGDLARRAADGNLEFLGRADQQVKIRGYRIEPGETEAALLSHPEVRQAMVIAREDTPGEKRLVAYVVAAENTPIRSRGLQRLPNGLPISQINHYETRALFNEIFEDRIYLKHGITLDEDCCVFDVGANIGLFSLFVCNRHPGIRVYAFEPAPPVFERLSENIALYGLDVSAFQCGLSREEGVAEIRHYPRMTANSGFYADAQSEAQVMRAFLGNIWGDEPSLVQEMLAGTFESEVYRCRLKTLSQMLRELNVERVDLLKIDVEKSEWDVLAGIEPQDWPKLRQIVLEVHDIDGRLDKVVRLLESHGFACTVAQERKLAGTGIHQIYARSREAVAKPGSAVDDTVRLAAKVPLPVSEAELLAHLKARLPHYMIPSAFVMLNAFPLTPNGKVDRNALPAPDKRPRVGEFTPPRTVLEEALASIWAQVLRVERVGVEDNFFELGGHSLLATRVTALVRDVLQMELPLRTLFDSPTVAALAEQAESARRREQGLVLPPLVREPHEGPLPLSFAQERLWFLEQLGLVGPAYNLVAAFRLEGVLDKRALERCVAELVARHESLRTRFEESAGQPVQVIGPPEAVRLERVAYESHLLHEAAIRRFDLARGPLFSICLMQVQPQEHVLLMTMHHIVSDGWSMGVLARELGALYAAFIRDQPSPLPALELQYADYALWQRKWLSGQALDRPLAYWKQRLDAAETLLLPTDRPRPAVQSFRGAVAPLQLSKTLSAQLSELARTQGVTLFMVLLAGIQALLSRLSGQQDIVVGSPIAGRTHRRTESLIGFFVNVLALRTDLSGDPTFRELLPRVKEGTLGAYAHQDVPFEKVVEALQPVRDLSRQPVFQVDFAFQNAPRELFELPGLKLTPLGREQLTARLDLSFELAETPAGLVGAIRYATDLFERPTVERLAQQLSRLFESAVAAPDCPISQLPLLSEAQRHQLLVEWNDTAREYPHRLVHERISEQAARTPDAVAVISGSDEITYAKLEARSNQLAHYLLTLGAGPEAVVGLCVERSVEMIVALLGILKAGCAYLPLDPGYPAERVSYMLRDARACVLLTQERLERALPEFAGPVVRLDTGWRLIDEHPRDLPAIKVDADSLAYVIYTSGSTGKPKGVMIAHQSFADLVAWAHEELGCERLSRVWATTSLSFDVSVFEIFAPLCGGGCIRVIADLLALTEYKETDWCGSLISAVPSALASLMSATPAPMPRGISTVVLAGEALPASLVDRVRAALPGCHIANLYGPTEATVYTTLWNATQDDARPDIGRPIRNTRVYILDRAFQPVPIAVAGELYIGGAGVARGYLNRASLTAERFVPDPFSTDGERLYRTGDLARWNAKGQLEFIGRLDHQVKIRGFRIELGEVQAALLTHPCVREAVVAAREDEPGEKRLVAYVVSTQAQSGTAGDQELRAYLRQQVPEYLVPSAFVMLENLPLTPNGKVDRARLPAPPDPSKGMSYIAPRTAMEQLLAGIWAQLLRVERVGLHDSFFDLGGHSLLATSMMSRVRARTGIELPLRTLFEVPVLADFARRVDAVQRLIESARASSGAPDQECEEGVI